MAARIAARQSAAGCDAHAFPGSHQPGKEPAAVAWKRNGPRRAGNARHITEEGTPHLGRVVGDGMTRRSPSCCKEHALGVTVTTPERGPLPAHRTRARGAHRDDAGAVAPPSLRRMALRLRQRRPTDRVGDRVHPHGRRVRLQREPRTVQHRGARLEAALTPQANGQRSARAAEDAGAATPHAPHAHRPVARGTSTAALLQTQTVEGEELQPSSHSRTSIEEPDATVLLAAAVAVTLARRTPRPQHVPDPGAQPLLSPRAARRRSLARVSGLGRRRPHRWRTRTA